MLAAFGAILYGLQTGSDWSDRQWLQALGVSGLLLLVAWWPAGTTRLPPFNRSTMRLATVLLVAFALVSVQLVRVQIVQSERTLDRQAVTPDGQVVQDPRQQLEGNPERRGSILDRNGVVLAETVTDDNGARRVYPLPAAAGVLGYYSPGLYGTSEIEAALDEELSGDAGGNPVSEWLDGVLHREQPGYDVMLTIDAGLQQRATELLGERNGAVVMMDAESGELLALAGLPTYDPSRLYIDGESSDEQRAAAAAYWQELLERGDAPLVFRPTEGLYVPGSIFKMVTASAILDAGLATPETLFRDEGVLEVDGRVIIELNRPDETKVDWTLEESFAYSLNVVFARIGLELGPELLAEYASRFGVGVEPPLEIDSSASRLTSEGSSLADSRTLVADTAFGQGELLMTPLQMALIGAAIANEGVIMQPQIVHRVVDEDGDVLEEPGPNQWRRPISEETAAAMHQLMLASAEYGYASGAPIEGLSVGGKTGTAETGTDQSHAWFVGYADDGERTLVVSVIVEFGGSGGQTALPIGRELLAQAFGM
jgi:peptidoglycan glycosyltransferase